MTTHTEQSIVPENYLPTGWRVTEERYYAPTEEVWTTLALTRYCVQRHTTWTERRWFFFKTEHTGWNTVCVADTSQRAHDFVWDTVIAEHKQARA